MLLLTRKIGESIEILVGNGITVTIVGMNGHQVRIGIDADRDVQIMRTELLKQPPKQSRLLASA